MRLGQTEVVEHVDQPLCHRQSGRDVTHYCLLGSARTRESLRLHKATVVLL